MLYIGDKELWGINIDWEKCLEYIEQAIMCYQLNEYSQPIKPYVRFPQKQNRIIAMPAYLGGQFDIAGIKWIASFPENYRQAKPRAHSVIVLNDVQTGEPKFILNSTYPSQVRTASVSGYIIRKYLECNLDKKLTVGIIGFGYIGRAHYEMCRSIFHHRIKEYRVYDIRGSACQDNMTPDTQVVDSWEEVIQQSDIVITCTVASTPYIDQIPKNGSLILNVSLRDFKTDIFPLVKDAIIVDDWEEVCRESTDIQRFHDNCGLKKENVYTMIDVLNNTCQKIWKPTNIIMFNPMGMAIYDLAVAWYLTNQINQDRKGVYLE